ncbi:MAG TPA: hypothetical protein VJV05_04160 [Pyrinomonadaceae bacterium]|nr:hypothetical protein [Pyrinomonadaceae bacterium]
MSVCSELPRSKAALTSMSLYAVVKARDGAGGGQWKEVADLISVSPTGASFNLPRPLEAGTLVSLMIPMPSHMRCYDFDKEFYRVWGLIQHCAPMNGDGAAKFQIGVAFIGKKEPSSHQKNPLQQYRIAGVDDDGLWRVQEAVSEFKKRADVRFWTPVDLYLALVDRKDGSLGGERTTAENVSRSGAAVFTTLEVGIGDRVKFISEKYDFSGLAVVCNRQKGTDDRTRLHLRFVTASFPIEALMKSDELVEQRA